MNIAREFFSGILNCQEIFPEFKNVRAYAENVCEDSDIDPRWRLYLAGPDDDDRLFAERLVLLSRFVDVYNTISLNCVIIKIGEVNIGTSEPIMVKAPYIY